MTAATALLAAAWQAAVPAPAAQHDTVEVRPAAQQPALDGVADDREYGAPRFLLSAGAGTVRIWLARHGDYIYWAAWLPDTTYYWGDDLVVSVDPAGVGGTSPRDGQRQWYLRRTLDSSLVIEARDGSWYSPGRMPVSIGATRHHDDWDLASTSTASGWTVELRIRSAAAVANGGTARLAFRTYNNDPHGWWSLPEPPAGTRPQHVERIPDLWIPFRLR